MYLINKPVAAISLASQRAADQNSVIIVVLSTLDRGYLKHTSIETKCHDRNDFTIRLWFPQSKQPWTVVWRTLWKQLKTTLAFPFVSFLVDDFFLLLETSSMKVLTLW